MRIAAIVLFLFAAPQQQTVTPRDLAVWQSALTWLQKDRGNFQLMGETTSGINLHDWKMDPKAIPADALADSEHRNVTVTDYDTDPKVAGVMFLPRSAWKGVDFRKATVQLSLPGYSADGNTAIMLATHSAGDKHFSIFFLLKNVKGTWQVTATHAEPFYVIVN